MSIYLTFLPPVSRPVRQLVKRLVGRIESAVELRHDLAIRIHPTARVFLEYDSSHIFGYFNPYVDKIPVICVAGKELNEVGDTLTHELAHYEQWRDGLEMSEVGIKVRAKTLLKLMEGS